MSKEIKLSEETAESLRRQVREEEQYSSRGGSAPPAGITHHKALNNMSRRDISSISGAGRSAASHSCGKSGDPLLWRA